MGLFSRNRLLGQRKTVVFQIKNKPAIINKSQQDEKRRETQQSPTLNKSDILLMKQEHYLDEPSLVNQANFETLPNEETSSAQSSKLLQKNQQ